MPVVVGRIEHSLLHEPGRRQQMPSRGCISRCVSHVVVGRLQHLAADPMRSLQLQSSVCIGLANWFLLVGFFSGFWTGGLSWSKEGSWARRIRTMNLSFWLSLYVICTSNQYKFEYICLVSMEIRGGRGRGVATHLILLLSMIASSAWTSRVYLRQTGQLESKRQQESWRRAIRCKALHRKDANCKLPSLGFSCI